MAPAVVLRAVGHRTWSFGEELSDTDAAPTEGRPGAAPPVTDVERVASALTAFVNTHIMARSRPLRPDDDLEAAGVDSMGLLKILLFIEARFGFWMPDADLRAENVSSLGALAAYVSRWRGPA
jgi:acyl carrier protein